MWGNRSVWGLVLCFMLLVALSAPAYAQRDMDSRDLNGISPKYHRYLFSVLGGAAMGAGIGVLVGDGTEAAKFALMGGGGVSSWYLTTHRGSGGPWRDWAFIASNTALGAGMGWTVCGCNDGFVAGALIGGGGTAAWRVLRNDPAVRSSRDNLRTNVAGITKQ